MKIKILAATLFVIIALVVSSVTPVLAVPPLPSGFYGTIKVNGSNVVNGTVVRALVNGVQYATAQTFTYNGESWYSILVPGDDPSTPSIIEGGVQGNTVVFAVADNDVAQTGTWASGTNIQLDLTLSPTAVTLVAFSGRPQYTTVRLDWTTITESDLLGFNVIRSETLNGVKQKRNTSLLQPAYPGQYRGSNYQFVDAVDQGHHYFYWIELVNIRGGNDLSDPVELTANYLMFVPLLH
jgi:hypothetical protein